MQRDGLHERAHVRKVEVELVDERRFWQVEDIAAGVEARTADHTLADVLGQISHAGERPVGAEWVGGEYGGHVY